MPVCYFPYILTYINLDYRQACVANPSHHIATFGLTTSTSSLRKHLFSDHLEEWSTACDTRKIPITVPAAIEAIRKFRNEPGSTTLEAERPEYSKEAFIDAIVDFVVGDDQVRVEFYFII
jgi:hypothetical protein